MTAPSLILASRSPRRATLLKDAGYVFSQEAPPYDDPAHPQTDELHSAQETAIELATRKARSFFSRKNAIILSADSLIVHCDGSLAGTPETADEARDMIRKMIGCTHHVVTGVALRLDDDIVDQFADSAAVTIDAIEDDVLEAYLTTDHWQGKAGGYNLFDRQAAGWPITTEGDDATIVGLPMVMLVDRLAKFGVLPTNQPQHVEDHR